MIGQLQQGSYFFVRDLPEPILGMLNLSLRVTTSDLVVLSDLDSDDVVVLVNQDCDILAKKSVEPFYQFFVAQLQEKKPQSKQYAIHSTRTLALDIDQAHFLLSATSPCYLKKHLFDCHRHGIARFNHLDRDQTRLVKRWAAMRFTREAFPNAFDKRIGRLKEKKINWNFPAELYVRLDSYADNRDVYKVAIIAVESHREIDANADDAAIVSQHDQMFSFMDDIAESIDECKGLSFDREWMEDNMNGHLYWRRGEIYLAQLDMFKRWNLDYLSYLENDVSPNPVEP